MAREQFYFELRRDDLEKTYWLNLPEGGGVLKCAFIKVVFDGPGGVTPEDDYAEFISQFSGNSVITGELIPSNTSGSIIGTFGYFQYNDDIKDNEHRIAFYTQPGTKFVIPAERSKRSIRFRMRDFMGDLADNFTLSILFEYR